MAVGKLQGQPQNLSHQPNNADQTIFAPYCLPPSTLVPPTPPPPIYFYDWYQDCSLKIPPNSSAVGSETNYKIYGPKWDKQMYFSLNGILIRDPADIA